MTLTMAWRSMPLQIASRSVSSARIDPGAPLKVKWYQLGAGARRIAIPGVRCAVTMSSSVPTPAASMRCSAGRGWGGVVEHQVGDGVQQRRRAPPSRVAGQHDALRVRSSVETMNGPADGPGPLSWPLLKTSGFAVMLRGSILPANIPRHSA